MKFPIEIKTETDVDMKLLRELLTVFARNCVAKEGNFLEATVNMEAEVLLKLHDGQIAKGSKASVNITKQKVYVGV